VAVSSLPMVAEIVASASQRSRISLRVQMRRASRVVLSVEEGPGSQRVHLW